MNVRDLLREASAHSRRTADARSLTVLGIVIGVAAVSP